MSINCGNMFTLLLTEYYYFCLLHATFWWRSKHTNTWQKLNEEWKSTQKSKRGRKKWDEETFYDEFMNIEKWDWNIVDVEGVKRFEYILQCFFHQCIVQNFFFNIWFCFIRIPFFIIPQFHFKCMYWFSVCGLWKHLNFKSYFIVRFHFAVCVSSSPHSVFHSASVLSNWCSMRCQIVYSSQSSIGIHMQAKFICTLSISNLNSVFRKTCGVVCISTLSFSSCKLEHWLYK